MIPSDDDRQFALICVTTFRDQLIAKIASAPPEVRADLEDDLDWADNPVSAGDIERLEMRLPTKLPPTMVAYAQLGFQWGIEVKEYFIPALLTVDDDAGMTGYLLHEQLWPLGFLQFGSGPCGDPLCLDFGRRDPAGECPVVVINHDSTPRDAWDSRERLEEWAEELAPSFREFLFKMCVLGSAEDRDI